MNTISKLVIVIAYHSLLNTEMKTLEDLFLSVPVSQPFGDAQLTYLMHSISIYETY